MHRVQHRITVKRRILIEISEYYMLIVKYVCEEEQENGANTQSEREKSSM